MTLRRKQICRSGQTPCFRSRSRAKPGWPTALAQTSIALLFVSLGGAPLRAQMQLPGAVGNGGSSATTGKSPAGGESGGAPPPAPARPVVIAPPGEDTIAGHPLVRDGIQGDMEIGRSGDGLSLTKLSLPGEKISKPGQTCSVDAPLPAPLALTDVGRPAGTLRFAVPLASCPFNIDILDGAALVTSPSLTCDYPAADCRVSPGGLWGPRAADITPKRAKDLERERVRLETDMRANFRALIKKAGKDQAAVKAIARDQAAFSSEREMTCRDYDGETAHGFCSTQITQARALALLAQFGPISGSAHEHRRSQHARALPPRGTATAVPTPAGASAPPK